MQNKTGNAQVVSTSTQKEKTEPSMGIEIPKKALALAKSVGIDLKPIVAWAGSVEKRLQLMQEEMPERTARKLMEIAKQERQEQIKQMQQNPQAQIGRGGGLSDLMQVASMFGGGGEKSETDKYFMRVGMDTVGLGHELYKSFIKEMVPQVIERWNKRKRELGLEKTEG